MRLRAPSKMPSIPLVDIHGNLIIIGNGRKMVLSLFREASCPFCNYRVYELTHNHPGLSRLGVDIVVIFKSSKEDVLRFIARQSRPFHMVADPHGNAHLELGINSSLWGKIKSMMFRFPAFLKGMKDVGMRGMTTGNLMPADFLIDERGNVVETYYGNDAGDHIPMERIELFSVRGLTTKK